MFKFGKIIAILCSLVMVTVGLAFAADALLTRQSRKGGHD